MSTANRLLIVHSDNDLSGYFASVARSCGYFSSVANTYDEFVEKLSATNPTVILLDQSMPGKNAIEFLKVLNRQQCLASIVIVGAVDDRAARTVNQLAQILELNLFDSISRPFSVYSFRRALKKLATTDAAVNAAEIATALRDGEIHVQYQPRASSIGGRLWGITAVDAVAILCRDDAEIPLPREIRVTSASDKLMSDLTYAIVAQVSSQLKEWSSQGTEYSASVNLSACSLSDRNLPDRLQRLMRKAGVDNSRLTLDITEYDVFDHSAETMEILNRLHVKGFRIAIDEFGTGHSSLEQLYRLPFNELKIDLSFVSACEMSHEARAIVEASILVGHKLGMDICAQGVANRKTFDYLKKLGCDAQQGFFVGRAVPAHKLPGSVQAWNAGGRKSGGIGGSNGHQARH